MHRQCETACLIIIDSDIIYMLVYQLYVTPIEDQVPVVCTAIVDGGLFPVILT